MQKGILQQRPLWIEKVVGSLALRVLLICTVLLVIPLLLHTFIVYRQDYLIKMRELFLELTILGKGREQFLEKVISLRQENLDLIAQIVEGKPADERDQLLEQIKEQESLTTLAYVPGSLQTSEKTVYLASDPLTGIKQLYLSKPISGGELLLGLAAQDVIDRLTLFESAAYPFQLSLLDEAGNIFVREGPKIGGGESLKIFSLADIEKQPLFSRFMRIEKKGGHIGLKVPVNGTSFSLLIDIPQGAILQVESHEMLSRMSILFLLILCLGGGAAVWLTRRMARPLKALCGVMESVGEGDLRARFRNDFMGFEINVLGKNFNRMIDSLLKHMEEAKNQRVARELLVQELKIGHEIQKSILPREMPEVPGLDIAAGFLAAQEVAGDFYDLFYKQEQNRLVLAIADASGKGVSACLYSLCVRSMLRSFASTQDDLSETIRATNNLFCQDTGDTGTFVTAWVASLDMNTRQLHYSSCGHPPAILKRKNGSIEELSTPNMALGVMPFEQISSASIQLFSGDLLILYTDGLLEAHDPKMQLFGKARILEIVNALPETSAEEMIQIFLNKVALFAREAAQFDDLTLLIVRIL